jgi:hypothetical protein
MSWQIRFQIPSRMHNINQNIDLDVDNCCTTRVYLLSGNDVELDGAAAPAAEVIFATIIFLHLSPFLRLYFVVNIEFHCYLI